MPPPGARATLQGLRSLPIEYGVCEKLADGIRGSRANQRSGPRPRHNADRSCGKACSRRCQMTWWARLVAGNFALEPRAAARGRHDGKRQKWPGISSTSSSSRRRSPGGSLPHFGAIATDPSRATRAGRTEPGNATRRAAFSRGLSLRSPVSIGLQARVGVAGASRSRCFHPRAL